MSNFDNFDIDREKSSILLHTSGGAFVLSILAPWIVAFAFVYFPSSVYYIVCSILPYLVTFIITALVISRHKACDVFGLSPSSASSIMLACLAQSAVYPMMLFLSSLCAFVWPSSTSGFESVNIISIDMVPLWGYFSMAVLPAICEELLFRGLIYGAFRSQGFSIAAMISTLSFALMHGNIEQIVYTMLFGLLLAFIREFTGSVIPGMCAHFVLNSVGVTMMYFGDAIYGNAEADTNAIMISSWDGFWSDNLPLLIVGLFGLALAASLVILIKRINKYRFNERCIECQKLPFAYALGWGLCLAECWIN